MDPRPLEIVGTIIVLLISMWWTIMVAACTALFIGAVIFCAIAAIVEEVAYKMGGG